ncbi:hypothetical protein FBZ89_106221 [Nitrospirillum amazonense]|uniref:Lysozyme inhibitor LprI N-terminal domain-containing protein n=1 Tax=Nitrospirillum amazonense TaxID=28077 RepID=A0A560FGT8_9PROT|nr:lysozyme inhibitor LprI family protein [Nitrospirillum amazonense]TWB20817.1 hypothetical protein FBZ89_106221 [Nitrospirillum amazonense]
MNRLPLLSATALFLSGIAQAATANPSFDCAAAVKPAEKAICADPKLAALDADIAALYKNALGKAGPAADGLKVEQRRWLQGRDTPPGQPPFSKERLADWLAARRAALSVLATQKAPLPICERVAATLRVLRAPGSQVQGGPWPDQLLKAGLTSRPTPEQSFTEDLEIQLIQKTKDMRGGDTIPTGSAKPIGKDYAFAQINITGGIWASCSNFVVFRRTPRGAFQALPQPKGTDDDFCHDGRHEAGFDMITLAGEAISRPALVMWNDDSLSIRQAQGVQWGDVCDIDITYDHDYSVADFGCDADAVTCEALKRRALDWSRIFGGPEPDTQGPGPGYRFPGLEMPAIDLDDDTMMDNPVLNAFPALKGWASVQVEGGPHHLWRETKEPLVIGINGLATSHDQPLDDFLISAWHQKDGKWKPVAGFITSPHAIGAPTVKATVTPAEAEKP